MSANKKVFSKNQTLLRLSWIENLAETIPWVSRGEPSIFWASTLVGLGLSPSLTAKGGVIALTSLPESIKALTLGWSSWNWTGNQIQGTHYKGPILASELAVTEMEVAETAATFLP